MHRRGFFAWSLGMAGFLAGCGTERVTGGTTVIRTEYAINPGGPRWADVAQAFADAARAAGYRTGGGRPITVTGLPELAAAQLNNGQSLFNAATPLSRLIGDVEVVVVPAGSPFKSFDDFGAQLLAQPGRTPLAGGPQGEPDHLLFGLIAKGLGADTRQVDYTGYPSSGEAGVALLGGKAAAAAGLFTDWRTGIGSGRVRVLAVSSAARIPDLEDVPTLLECGVRVDFSDWVAAFGPIDMTDEGRESAIRMCEEVTASPGWRAACRAAGWISAPLSGDDFGTWLGSEAERTRAVLRDLGLIDTTRSTTCWVGCRNGH
ncbi:hypothetical protein ITP53_16115 [Nonomuraea sp. K274]|uniref:Tricarboxylic transport membrane protein n=1 Tax=Nonomuraea cypriaca TaxID=1187855 RepID=A0A931A6M7_9ACTN|nr:tripartite tricarboxylate transporter substrate-binding protein [Nonomuraea cypriaca]MBF8187231.1 hypothetical protein [Nonomuraea cypriaca]